MIAIMSDLYIHRQHTYPAPSPASSPTTFLMMDIADLRRSGSRTSHYREINAYYYEGHECRAC
jgi:hypothetical protein